MHGYQSMCAHTCAHTKSGGHVITWAFSHQLFTMDVEVKSLGSPCGVSSRQNSIGKGLSHALQFSPANYHHPPVLHTHQSSGSGTRGPFGAHSTTKLLSHPTLQVQKNGKTNMSFIYRCYLYSKLYIPAGWAPYWIHDFLHQRSHSQGEMLH